MEKAQLTPKQKKFFKQPKQMIEIMNDLFDGDAWAANEFQNYALNNNLLILKDSRFELAK